MIHYTRFGVEPPAPKEEVITEERLAEIRTVGFDALSSLIAASTMTTLQQDVLTAVKLYSRAAIAREPSDKIVYVLSALESLLLRDSSESIQQNLGERLAFLIADDAEQRKQVVRSVRDVYKIRSAFVHHGASISDFEALGVFMLNAWVGVVQALANCQIYTERKQLLDKLDDLKMA